MSSKSIISIVAVIVLVGIWFIFSDSEKKMSASKKSIESSSVKVGTLNNKKIGIYKNISAEGLYSMLDMEKRDFVLINVHIPYIGEIAGTDRFIAFNKIQNNLDKLPADKEAKIILYCQSGGMSAIAAQTLANLGYINVKNLSGGMIKWKKNRYPLEYNDSK